MQRTNFSCHLFCKETQKSRHQTFAWLARRYETKGQKLVNRIGIIILLTILTSCVFIPAVSGEQSNCVLHTKKLELKGNGAEGAEGLMCGHEACLVLLAAASAVTLSTLIVSGSIVLVGNTFHWIEKEGTCNEGYIKTKIEELNQLLGINKLGE
jgi:hypothetical protein